jgi:glycosyltransferase involved in cell wall biosynthesis
MIQLYFDGRFIRPDQPDGISRFSLGLIGELKQLVDLKVLVCSERQREVIGEGVEFVELSDPTSIIEIFTGFKLNRLGVQTLFSPMQTTSGLGRKFKLILTLHDLIYYRHRTPPREFNPMVRALWFLYHLSYWPQRLVLNGADAVVTVSESSKKQILEKRLTKREVRVVYNAAEAAVVEGSRHHSRKLVYMGSFIGYKNVETLIRAAALLPDFDLVLLSKISPTRESELQSLADSLGARVSFLNGVSDERYRQELSGALALVSASKDEGFGIPVVEAMATGTPVVLSDLEIFHEVAAAAGLYFTPDDPSDLVSQITLLTDEDQWRRKSMLGIEQAKRFSWRQSAEDLLRLVRDLA